MLRPIGLSLALALMAWTQTRFPLASIRVTGNKAVPAEAIIRATGLQVGQPVNQADLEQAAGRLTEAGVFETLSFRYAPEGKQFAVTFEVQEVVDLHPVAFERLQAPDDELMRLLGEKVPLFGPRVPATGAMVKRIAAALEARVGAGIVGRLAPGPGGALAMTFRPAEAPPAITFVKFQGSRILRDADLQGAFYQVAVGTPYLEPRLNELLDHNIRPLFEEKGLLRVRFGPLSVEESKQPAGVVVTVTVQEGDEYTFGRIRVEGNQYLEEKPLKRLVRAEEGKPANFALVRQALADIARLGRRNGFLNAKAGFERTLDDEKKTADVVIRVEEGQQYRFRSLEIKGIDINAAAVVKRRWGIQRGQPYDATYPEVFLKTIEEEQMFDRLAKTAYQVAIDEPARMVDVEITFQGEAPKKKGADRKP